MQTKKREMDSIFSQRIQKIAENSIQEADHISIYCFRNQKVKQRIILDIIPKWKESFEERRPMRYQIPDDKKKGWVGGIYLAGEMKTKSDFEQKEAYKLEMDKWNLTNQTRYLCNR